MSAYLTYALDENDNSVHVDKVLNGAKCACHCPYCKAPLYAKNGGDKRQHHFAHAKGHDCGKAFESMLHHLAKEILTETPYIVPPPDSETPKGWPTKLIHINNIQIEKKDNLLGIIPDAECIMDNGERLLLEFYVTHKVDKRKREIIVSNNLKCIEFDLNYMSLNKQRLYAYLINSQDDRKWILEEPKALQEDGSNYPHSINPIYNNLRHFLKELFDQKTLIIRPFEQDYWGQNNQKIFDLKKYHYDVCVQNEKRGRFKSDLLLSRSSYDEKGYISLNVRGKNRSEDFRYPDGLRIIDIIIKDNMSEEKVKEVLKDGFIHSVPFLLDVKYHGFQTQ